MDTKDPYGLVKSLCSTDCPSCGNKKIAAQSLCGKCYYTLPQTIRIRLYDRLGNGYEQAMETALDYLGEKRKGATECTDATESTGPPRSS